MSIKWGSEELVVALDKYKKETERWAKKGIAKVTNAIYNEAVARAPVDLGFLKESIDFKYENDGYKSVISVGAEYAIYVEFGTGVYATGPGGSRAKKIPWSYKDADGEWHTTFGQEPQPFWFPALDKGRAMFNSYFS
ncbi:HK97-gp10 family putative phage morphogenesis protein [uncultured Staphylococcus sp.]|uniref:HK97-gp10 family putative phage morphogenesis protein n=1 Tax=uncultured Staphylococcus sp. TaxID=189668 RepID=UPI0025DF4EDD|nr:HK97-gp10 family putative phage morphogenesis protein [uncultured Staphylococcus sp.]